jgi:GNAT superfamily N-acetyltransferase
MTTAREITIRTARPPEARAITELVMHSKAHWGYDAAFLAACRPGLTISPEYLRTHPAYVAEMDGTLVGFASLYEHSPQNVELDYLFIAPAAMGKGVGKRLWRHAVSEAAGLGYQLMDIVADPNAEAFYRKMGAVTVGAEPSEAKAGRMLPLMHFDLNRAGS